MISVNVTSRLHSGDSLCFTKQHLCVFLEVSFSKESLYHVLVKRHEFKIRFHFNISDIELSLQEREHIVYLEDLFMAWCVGDILEVVFDTQSGFVNTWEISYFCSTSDTVRKQWNDFFRHKFEIVERIIEIMQFHRSTSKMH